MTCSFRLCIFNDSRIYPRKAVSFSGRQIIREFIIVTRIRLKISDIVPQSELIRSQFSTVKSFRSYALLLEISSVEETPNIT